ncbi:MAG: putative Ig domain-containing protein [Nitrospirota bacterium]
MAEKRKKRPPQRKDNRTAIAVVVILVAIASVIAVVRYSGKTGSMDASAPGRAPGPGQAPGTTAVPQDNNAAVIVNAVIIPPKPTPKTPLSIAQETRNPEGLPLTLAFRWYVDGTLVQEGPSNLLQPGPYRKGSSVHADVTATDQQGGISSMTTPPVEIAGNRPEITTVTLGPENAAAGTELSATLSGTDQNGDPLQYQFQWRVNGNPVGAPGSESTFSTAELKKHDSINVVVASAGSAAGANPVVSNTIILQNRKPKITSTAPSELSGGLYTYQVSANDPDGDALTFRLGRYPAGMTIDASSGLIRWELPRGVMYLGRNEVAASVTVADGDGGEDSQDIAIIFTDLIVN